MVKRNYIQLWKCPYCSFKDKIKNNVEEHIENHHVESLESDEEIVYQCEVCKLEYAQKFKAVRCEEKHESGNDKKYQLYLDGLEKEKLIIASQHHLQTKLK